MGVGRAMSQAISGCLFAGALLGSGLGCGQSLSESIHSEYWYRIDRATSDAGSSPGTIEVTGDCTAPHCDAAGTSCSGWFTKANPRCSVVFDDGNGGGCQATLAPGPGEVAQIVVSSTGGAPCGVSYFSKPPPSG